MPTFSDPKSTLEFASGKELAVQKEVGRWTFRFGYTPVTWKQREVALAKGWVSYVSIPRPKAKMKDFNPRRLRGGLAFCLLLSGT
jgi:hypothetical protein